MTRAKGPAPGERIQTCIVFMDEFGLAGECMLVKHD
jgi:hypothetical protein